MSRASPFRRRRGQALVEFALIALVLAVMLGAMLSLGHMFFAAHTIQQAVDVAAQEIARTPFPAASELGLGSFEDKPNSVMATELFKKQIYDEQYLILDPQNFTDTNNDGTVDLTDIAPSLPLLNRLLLPVMICDSQYPVVDSGPNSNVPGNSNSNNGVYAKVFRYPGAIVEYDDNSVKRYTILIPLVEHEVLPHDPIDPDHQDVIEKIVRWVKPVEEIRSGNQTGAFSVAAHDDDNSSFQPGMVALRINYPFQAAALVRYVPTGALVGDNVREMDRVRANDDLLCCYDPPGQKYKLLVPANPPYQSVFGGRYGLGSTGSYRPRIHDPENPPNMSLPPNDPRNKDWDFPSLGVRPYRRVITAQAIYRREVFE